MRPAHRVQGIAASSGIALGRIFIIEDNTYKPRQHYLRPDDIEQEKQRFETALTQSMQQIRDIKNSLGETSDGSEHSLILEAHLMMLNDPLLVDGVKNLIFQEHLNAEWALEKTAAHFREIFENLSHGYFRERGSDIQFVCDRILRNLTGQQAHFQKSDVPPHAIVIAQDLSPAHTALLSQAEIAGIITEEGSKTSHAAIVARSLNIPAVVGVSQIVNLAKQYERVLIDGFLGDIILNPNTIDETEALKNKASQTHLAQHWQAQAHIPATTQDGQRVFILGNIELPSEAKQVQAFGGEGIGLFRSEFLYVNQEKMMTENEHFWHYQQLAESLPNQIITIRTLDIGGDKIFHALPHFHTERNPALGLRAIRLCLAYPELIKTQIKAILRVTSHPYLRLLIPMVTDLNEVCSVKKLIQECQEELKQKGIPCRDTLPLGIMIETPSAVLILESLAPMIDFIAIGTNDLIQYTLAIDRTNESVAYLYRPLHPAILRLLKHITNIANQHRLSTSLCGEMASDEYCLPVLLGLGLRTLSMNAPCIPQAKAIVRKSRICDCETLASTLLTQTSAQDNELLTQQFYALNYK